MSKYELVRNLILDLRPFYLHELVEKASEAGITDKHIIFQALNDLFDEGLIVYRKDGTSDDPLSPSYKYRNIFVAP